MCCIVLLDFADSSQILFLLATGGRPQAPTRVFGFRFLCRPRSWFSSCPVSFGAGRSLVSGLLFFVGFFCSRDKATDFPVQFSFCEPQRASVGSRSRSQCFPSFCLPVFFSCCRVRQVRTPKDVSGPTFSTVALLSARIRFTLLSAIVLAS
jgi:hypothetical protein